MGEKPFKCKECDNVAYNNSFSLKIHVMKVHQGVKFLCDICGKDFWSNKHRRQHIRGIHGKDPDKITVKNTD